MLTILIFVIVLGVLIFVHELGHFLTARRNGVKAEEFGFGFPPRVFGVVFDDFTKKFRLVKGNEDVESPHTVYSLNWIPLGGFVRIKGEDRDAPLEPDSFAGKSAWVRFKILVAGVVMNFLLAWVLFSVVLMLGFPEQINPEDRAQYEHTQVQILQVQPGTPAESIGLLAGDVLKKLDTTPVKNLSVVTDYIAAHKGKEIAVTIDRGGETLVLKGTPRTDAPAGEGALGISFSETAIVEYGFFEALWKGLEQTYLKTAEIFTVLGTMLASLFTGAKTSVDIAGPVGIVYLTKQMSELGLAYLLYFAAILSIHLGIIHALPIPALDGGRILFILIEKLKGSPVSQKVEGYVHQIGFMLLLLLMVWVTFYDILRFNIWDKFFG
ncbi:MAG: RIP metalloprotease RseP [Candidatus Moraniibacteriota bacterium]|nr:MAG: RIP metalloprotease RseP [Candidatus Moranbacteria bacterium]